MKFFNSSNVKSFAILLFFLGLNISFPVMTDQSVGRVLQVKPDLSVDDTMVSEMECLLEYILSEGLAIYDLIPDTDWDQEKTHLENHLKFDYLAQDLPLWQLFPPEAILSRTEQINHYRSKSIPPGHGPPKNRA